MSRCGRSGFELEAAELKLRRDRAKRGWDRRRREGFQCKPQRRRCSQLSRDRFMRRNEAWREHAGIGLDRRGQQTEWLEYQNLFRLHRLEGSKCRTTNGQRAKGLELAGRPRCERTVRRVHRRLEAQGVIHCFHEQRWGRQKGRKDRLRVHVPRFLSRSTMSAPPSGSESATKSLSLGPAKGGQKHVPPASPAEIEQLAPPDGGRERRAPPPAAPNCSDEEVSAGAVDDGPPAALPEPLPETLEGLEAALRDGFPGGISDRRGHRQRGRGRLGS